MKHVINDAAFQTWYINQPAISYQSLQLMMQTPADQLNTIVHDKGFNIYKLQVPIVAANVLISA
jgi:hypothetical protein